MNYESFRRRAGDADDCPRSGSVEGDDEVRARPGEEADLVTMKVSEHTATYLMERIRRSMTEREFGRLTVAELVHLYRQRKLDYILERTR